MRDAFKDFAIVSLLIVAAGLLLILIRQHKPAEIAVSPLTPAAGKVVCVPPASHYQFKQRRIA